MKGLKKLLSLVLAVAMVATLAPAVPAKAAGESDSITILYTNDTHTYIDNKKDDKELLSYGNVAALKKDIAAAGGSVLLVDAGDHSQGTAYGALDEGKAIIDIMNAAGYDLATVGNHEFDYGMDRAMGIIKEANFPYISSNFIDLRTNKSVLDAYKVFDLNGKKIAFVGVSTPETIAKGTPTYFMDSDGNFIYDFLGDKTGDKLAKAFQEAIDAARKEADYVIGLGHLGVDAASSPYTSKEIISKISGLDAFIDGHSHTVMESESVKDKAGKTVVLTQTGSYLSNIGKMTIDKDGNITATLVSEYEKRDEAVDGKVKALIEDVNGKLGVKIATNGNTKFYTQDKDNSEIRVIRSRETNLGDLTSDAVYYFFNIKEGIDCDVAIVNGGGIRAEIDPGADITYDTLKKIHTFGNVVCLMEMSGQQILDMLEFSYREVGHIVDGKATELGGFLHTAGLKFDIDTGIESTVQIDDKKIWQGAPTGEYRVKNVQVYDKASGKYLPLDLDAKYNVGGINYILRKLGDGFNMFEGATLVKDYVGEDYLVLAEYIKAFSKDESGMPVINTENSPLKSYSGYLINYEKFEGAGRAYVSKGIKDTITTPTTTPAVSGQYVVVKGDSLWKIAKKQYDDGNKYKVIYNANKDTIKNPNMIKVGQVLTIPAVA